MMKKAVPFLILAGLFAVAAWYFFTTKPAAIHELPPPQVAPVAAVEAPQIESPAQQIPSYTEIEPAPAIIEEPLPPLDQSDIEITQALAGIVGDEPLQEYLVQDQAISRLVATLDSLTSRQVPAQINPVKPADDRFIVDMEGDSVVMSPRNFARYDGYVELLQATDTKVLMLTYQRYLPLFQQAWEQNGGEGQFNDRLVGVIDHLLETPDVPGPVYLTKPEAVYLFEDPVLEAMTAGQKILIRMGSANAAVVKEKLKAMRAEVILQG